MIQILYSTEPIKLLILAIDQNLCVMHILYDLGTSGSVQLQGGKVLGTGAVEYCVNGVWNIVCDSYWDYQDAFVVCRQLGFSATGKQVIVMHHCIYSCTSPTVYICMQLY